MRAGVAERVLRCGRRVRVGTLSTPSPTVSRIRSNYRQLLGFRQDWRWAGEKVADMVQLNGRRHRMSTVDRRSANARRLINFVADQILRETLLTVSSDWPFMVSKDSAAEYARYRAHLHAHATREISAALASGRFDAATA
jgi:1,4-alpha-glucan branching enzyme